MIENSEGITTLFIPFSDALPQSSDASFDSLGTRNDNYFEAPSPKYAKPKGSFRVSASSIYITLNTYPFKSIFPLHFFGSSCKIYISLTLYIAPPL
jgi:hypothetical protein